MVRLSVIRLMRRSPCFYSNKNFSEEHPSDLNSRHPKEVIKREFPEHFSGGKYISRISYIDFIDQALDKLKELGLEKNLEAYKELLRVFPPEKYKPKSLFDIGMFHAPQQLCAIRLLDQMSRNMVKTDREVERLVIERFSLYSDVWKKVARENYWSMKGRNVDRFPIPEKIPEKTHEVAIVAIRRMLDDPKATILVRNTSRLPNVVDKTWVVYSQSPLQQSIISRLTGKDILYIERGGITYVGSKFLTYYLLKVYDDEETVKKRSAKKEPDYNFNTLKVQFYGKTVEKKLEELEMIHHDGEGHILAVGMTGTSSQDSVLSWLKLMQMRNPNLKNLNIVFRIERPTRELSILEKDKATQ